MKYEVRFIVDNEERSETIEVENAAEAAEHAQQTWGSPERAFELIQVTLLDEFEPNPPAVSEA